MWILVYLLPINMADEEEEKDELFSNDGNFLERFKRLEEERKKKEEEEKEEKKPAPGPIIPGRRKNMKIHPPGSKKAKGAPTTFPINTKLTVQYE